jgi:hypothetical protein
MLLERLGSIGFQPQSVEDRPKLLLERLGSPRFLGSSVRGWFVTLLMLS